MGSEHDFFQQLRHRYTTFEDDLDYQEPNDLRQLWHTPTELFSPYYGEAIARYLVEDYKYNFYPYHDLNIYEMGAGNGTMMLNILDFIRDVHPEVYERTKFKIIEISSQLADLQQKGLGHSAYARGHADKVEIVNRSIFDWNVYVSSPCYFLALEVFDNFAHDALKYDFETGAPYQSHVVVDPRGELFEYYSRTLDPVASQFLERRHAACTSYAHPLQGSRLMNNLRSLVPFRSNMSTPEYIPTRLMQFFYMLYSKFPNHKLISSDFHKLSDAVEGINAPVVQTRYKRQMIPVSTPLVSLLALTCMRNCANGLVGPPRLLRYPLPDRLRSYGAHVYSYYRTLRPHIPTRGLHGRESGHCGDDYQEWGQSAAELVQERQCDDHCVDTRW
jgi:hypothetical protein